MNQEQSDFEKRFAKWQDKKGEESKAKIAELEKELPNQERILRLQQQKNQEELDKRKSELEEIGKDDLPIDISKFKELSSDELIQTLGLTIKRDEINKLITFLALLSAYSEDCQVNVSYNAPSASGKTFIPTEIARLFPDLDVIEVAYCSPTAFFHDYGDFDKEKEGYIVDFSKKILIFLDQPHMQLLQHLRPLLSHDKKEIRLKITDKGKKAGLKTKNIFLIGFPVVVFCTAGLNLDEQESTRFLLLSPETTHEKIREAILEKIKKESNSSSYRSEINSNLERQLLKERILAIKQEKISEIRIPQSDTIERLFLKRIKTLKPRHQRDIARVLSLVKVFALLNLWFRKRNGSVIEANEKDIEEAFAVWDAIYESQELNLPPFVFNFYKDIILTAFQAKNQGVANFGLTKQEINQKHYEVYGRLLPDWQLRQQIIPLLETAGLIIQEAHPDDKRKILIVPTAPLTISQQNNSEPDGGVNSNQSLQDKPIEQLSDKEQTTLLKSIFGKESKWASES